MGRGRPPDVGRRRKFFRARRQVVAVGNTYDEVVFDPLLEREFLRIERIAVVDYDSCLDNIRLYVRGHGYPHWIGETYPGDPDVICWVTRPTYLVAGEQVVARFYAATASDNLEMLLEGWIIDYPMPREVDILAVVEAGVD